MKNKKEENIEAEKSVSEKSEKQEVKKQESKKEVSKSKSDAAKRAWETIRARKKAGYYDKKEGQAEQAEKKVKKVKKQKVKKQKSEKVETGKTEFQLSAESKKELAELNGSELAKIVKGNAKKVERNLERMTRARQAGTIIGEAITKVSENMGKQWMKGYGKRVLGTVAKGVV